MLLSIKGTGNKSLAYENREVILPPVCSLASKIQSIFLQRIFQFKNLKESRNSPLPPASTNVSCGVWEPQAQREHLSHFKPSSHTSEIRS